MYVAKCMASPQVTFFRPDQYAEPSIARYDAYWRYDKHAYYFVVARCILTVLLSAHLTSIDVEHDLRGCSLEKIHDRPMCGASAVFDLRDLVTVVPAPSLA